MRQRRHLPARMWFAIALALGAAATETAVASTTSGELHTLTAENFEEATAQGLWLLEFFAPWCAHCKALEPVLRDAAAKLTPASGGAASMHIGQVDATKHSALAKSHGVKGYPTLKWRRNGGAIRTYKGTRKLDGFQAFAERMNQPAVETLPGPDDAAALQKAAGATPVLFLLVLPRERREDDARTRTLAAAFDSVAAEHQHLLNLRFASCREGSGALALATQGLAPAGAERAAQAEHVAAERSHVLKLDADVTTLWDGGSSAEAGGRGGTTVRSALSHWVSEQRFPFLASLGASNFREMTAERADGKLLVVGVVDPADEAATLPFIQMLRGIALSALPGRGVGMNGSSGQEASAVLPEAVASKLGFGYIDGVRWGKFVSQFNVRAGALPTLFVLDGPAGMFYEQPPESDKGDRDGGGRNRHERAEVVAFLGDVVAGKVTAQKEGMGGLTGRISGMLSRHYPLSLLFGVPPLLLLCAVVQCCLEDDDVVEDDDDGGDVVNDDELKGAPQKKAD